MPTPHQFGDYPGFPPGNRRSFQKIVADSEATVPRERGAEIIDKGFAIIEMGKGLQAKYQDWGR